MEILDPKVYVEKYDGVKIMRNIERAMRTCYKSEGSMTSDSYNKLLKMAVVSGHESVMEHEKISVRFLTDVGAYKDLTRHRAGVAFSIESTRWCNYAKGKFDKSIKFMNPVHITDPNNYATWKETMKNIEIYYMVMADNKATPDQLRMLLPHSTAAEVCMTCNIREWRHILSLRTQKNVHPSIRQILIPLLLKFKQDMPILFEDIEYDTDFPKEWYAEITDMEDNI